MNSILNELEFVSQQDIFANCYNKSILVTGSNGMLGSYFAEIFIRAISNQPGSNIRLTLFGRGLKQKRLISRNAKLPKSINYISSLDQLNEVKFDFIFHFASSASPVKLQYENDLIESNVGLTKLLAERVSEGGVFIFASTSEIYGKSSLAAYCERDLPNFPSTGLRNYYPKAKLLGENWLIENSKRYGFAPVIPRIFHTFGPGVRRFDGRSFSDFIWDASVGNLPKIYGSGDDIRSFLHSADLFLGILNLISNQTYTPTNIGSAVPIKIKDFAEKVSMAAGLNGLVEFADTGGLTNQLTSSLPCLCKITKIGWKMNYDLNYLIKSTLVWTKMNVETYPK